MTGSGAGREQDRPVLDRPWRRPGAVQYGLRRTAGVLILRPRVTVDPPPPGAVLVRRDVPVPTTDGTVLRVNVHLPAGDGPFPVLMSAHPYGKDSVPRPARAAAIASRRSTGCCGRPARSGFPR